jgi:hypothetical protein
MSGSTASNSNVNANSPLTLRIADAQTSAENGRKFTKYKVSVNYNGREWEIWRRYKEFNTLNEKVRKVLFYNKLNFIFIFSFVVFVLI